MNVAIVGCGLIGRKRALALCDEDKLMACCDTNLESAKKFGEEFDCIFFDDYKKLLNEVDCDIVVVSVVNKYAKEIIINTLRNGKNVIAEKPLGRNVEEAREIVGSQKSEIRSQKSKSNGVMENWNSGKPNTPIFQHSNTPIRHDSNIPILKTGFNHRFHPAVWKAKQLADEGAIGKIFNIRARYGHGGRPGMENEWRASKDLCGGGELLDQGVHIIDLIRWFGGEVKEVYGKVETKFWEIQVEDNAFAILKTAEDVTASFHVSWTNWKNIFSFEIFGTDGYLKIEGLGGSYGEETLETGIRKKEGGKPNIEIFEFENGDVSWINEWFEFKHSVCENKEVNGSGIDGLRAIEVIEAIYKSNQTKKTIEL